MYQHHEATVIEPETIPARTPFCQCPEHPRGWWDCTDCPEHGEAASREGDAEHAAEMAAENAWLRHAEAPTNDDLGFEAWEAERCWR